MKVSLVAAVTANRVIEGIGSAAWSSDGEPSVLRQLTEGGVVAVGRRTYEVIGRPLLHCTTIVLTRDPAYHPEGCLVTRDLDEAIDAASERGSDLFIAGGADIYAQALPLADNVFLTTVAEHSEGDSFFPLLPAERFDCVFREDVRSATPYRFEVFRRREHIRG